MKKIALCLQLLITASLLALSAIAQAEVALSDAWVRATNPGQPVGAAYVTLKSKAPVTLVYVETERAGSVEMHSMSMDKGIMKMRSMEELPVPAGQTVKLAPGGLHLMLFELASPLKVGEQVKFRLCFKDKQGKITDQFVTMPVKTAQ
ncbi:copper chaperone PCu(A)C [Methylophilus aquaticus]|uniref:Copper chaperone PCu(A)C n=1 Tax=Methylophilus aquaticus TaxID=1971610 RepID=A0ABT9JR53_9PROT|nr:copper chaperone PCu(A)C [Methylophilus aquaticus]MDP8566949.1 copper chaperone PCu(A)C [Methylophilus aquaticus]